MSAQQPDDPGSLPRSVLGLAGRVAGFGMRTTVGVATTATRLTADMLDQAVSQGMSAVIDRVDVQRLIERVDIDAVLARIDVERILARVDLDGLVARVDINALLVRVDTVGIAREVIDGVDLPEIIRDSTGTMATETVGGLRLQTLHADELVAHFVDRIIRRNGKPPASPPDP